MPSGKTLARDTQWGVWFLEGRTAAKAGLRGVASLAVRVVVDLGEREGISSHTVLRGTGVTAADVRNPLERFGWGLYADILDRMQDALGSEAALTRAAEAMPATLPELTSFARAFVTPQALARFLFEVADPVIWPMVTFGLVDLGADRLEISGTLKRSFRGSRPYFVGSVGAAKGFTGYLGLPPAEVEAVDLSDRHIRVVLKLPPSRTLLRRAKGALPSAFSPPPVMMTAAPGRAGQVGTRLERARAQWGLSPRQVEVLRELVAGHDNREIARTLGCALKTVEAHVSALLERTDSPSRLAVVTAFWADLDFDAGA